MGLLALLALLAPPVLVALAQDTTTPALLEAWKDTWTDLARFEQARPGSPEHDRLWQDLDGFQVRHESSAKKRRDRVEVFRARLLRAHLSRLSGIAVRPLGEPGTTIQFLPGEAWLALQVAGPGPTRVEALRDALAEATGDDLRARVERGLAVADEDARGLHLDWAQAEARAVHLRAPDVRTIQALARVLRLSGEDAAASALLDQGLARAIDASERAALLTERADLRAATGASAACLADLGAALALGAGDAAMRLALRALSEGATGRARALFRSLLDAQGGSAPALRGYGIALLSSAGPPQGGSRNSSVPSH